MRHRLMRVIAASLAAGMILAACGGDDADTTTEPPPAEGDLDEGATDDETDDDVTEPVELSLSDLSMTFEAERTTQLMNLLTAKERTWDEMFDSVTMVATEDPIPALISGSAWIVQNEPTLLWPALDAGTVDGVIVAVFNDLDSWYLFTREGFDTPESLIGARFSGGTVGDSWNTVARIIMRDEFGINPDDVEFVSVGGGSDARMEALLAGQIDGFMGQPRHEPPVLEAGGNVLYSENVDMAQGMFLVTRDTWENHRDAVCAMLGGLFEANQWFAASELPDWSDRMPIVMETLTNAGYDPSENGLNVANTWATSQGTEFNWALDLGAPVEAWDRQLEILSRPDGEVSPDFDWRDWVDFSCVWELQEAAGLPLNPDPSTL